MTLLYCFSPASCSKCPGVEAGGAIADSFRHMHAGPARLPVDDRGAVRGQVTSDSQGIQIGRTPVPVDPNFGGQFI
jgi:hypothetical protein